MLSGAGQRVLVTGARLPAALEIARGLRAAGAEVWAADSLRITPTGVSRSVNEYLRLPSPALHAPAFRARVLAFVRRLNITMIVPASEEIFYLAQMRADLPAHTTLFAPSLAELEALHSKWRVLELAADCGARLPRTLRVESRAQMSEELDRYPDSVLKPEHSRGAYRTLFPPHSLLHDMRVLYAPWVVQECVTGTDISTFAITMNGRVLACATYLPRYRAGAGANLYFEPVVSPAADAFVARFASANATTGHLGFDFIQGADGELTLLECNPRATSGVHLVANNDSWARAYFGVGAPPTTSPEPRCSKFAVATLHGPQALFQRRLGALREDLRRARDTCFRADDRRPSLALPLSGLEIALRSLAWPVRTRHAYTFDLEWNGGKW
jgi:predicted ATP-grasp superfamily ATP-dependent carboligase